MGDRTDRTIRSTRGRELSLEALRGKTVVVFYEARDHVEDNLHLKESCGLLSESPVMRARFEVLGVANVRGLGFVEPVVRAAVGLIARRYGAELWMDFDGALEAEPYGFGSSTVAVFDPAGRLAFRADGPLDARSLDAFFEALGGSLDRRAASEVARSLAGRN